MLTLIGSLLGFGTSFLPKVLEFFQDRQDKKHELEMLREMRVSQKELADSRIELAEIQAESAADVARYQHDTEIVRTGGWLIAFMSGTVRPWTTHWFVGLFILTKLAHLAVIVLEAWLLYRTAVEAGVVITDAALTGGRHLADMMPAIWDDPTMAIFATIISFWFGDRCRKRAFGR